MGYRCLGSWLGADIALGALGAGPDQYFILASQGEHKQDSTRFGGDSARFLSPVDFEMLAFLLVSIEPVGNECSNLKVPSTSIHYLARNGRAEIGMLGFAP